MRSRLNVGLLLGGWVASAVAAAPISAEAILASMRRSPPAATAFIQVSYRGVLDRPLVVSGRMRWLGGDRLQREIEQPFHEIARAGDGELSVQRGHGEVRRLPIARAPQVGAMLTGFRALLDGDAAALQVDFSLTAEGSAAHWLITLTPRSRELGKHIAAIHIDGGDREARCLTVTDTRGDTSITLLGALADAGLRSTAPLQSALAARCRNGP